MTKGPGRRQPPVRAARDPRLPNVKAARPDIDRLEVRYAEYLAAG